ncbi:MAG: outer membrane protein assembly factor BamC [Gammaproteobacteria bacterium]|nr:outer membrane protein assembly factor BamC [Gammaproteobacteria bacterium]
MLKSLNFPVPSFTGRRHLFLFTGALLVVSLSGCSWFSSDTATNAEAPVLPSLEIPPDLVHPQGDPSLVRPELPSVDLAAASAGSATTACQCSELPRIGDRVLPEGKGVQRVREGQKRWLRVSVEPEQAWPLVRKFLEIRGYRIMGDEPAVGLLETDWKPRADDGDGASANWRERLRIRVEPAEQAGFTELYFSQSNSERVVSEQGEEQWQLRAPDQDRAVEMLDRLARFLTAENVQDAVKLDGISSRFDNDEDGAVVLLVDAPFEKVWRRTALALENLGFVIDDRDHANGSYRVYNEISTNRTETELKYGRPKKATVKERYTLRLTSIGSSTRIGVRTPKGVADSSQAARHVLNLLSGQLQ